MGMNAVFFALMLSGIVFAAATGSLPAAQEAMLSGASQALELCISLAGAYAFFGGMLQLLRESGAAEALADKLRGVLIRLLPFLPGEEAALGDISVNLASNMLGMGNAATPAGLSAMKTMAAAGGNTGTASDAMIFFFVLNSSCIELLPTTMIALRARYGAANPADVILPTLLSTMISAAVGMFICCLCAGKKGRRR